MYTEEFHDKINKKLLSDLEANSARFVYITYSSMGVTALLNGGLLPKRKA